MLDYVLPYVDTPLAQTANFSALPAIGFLGQPTWND